MTTKKSIDSSVNELLDELEKKQIETVFDRAAQQKPHCGFGEQGLCCHICYMGPCRINPTGKKPQKGVCGATADVIVARNFCRMIAAGTAAHSDHGREVAKTLLYAAQNPNSGYAIKDAGKLRKVAETLGIPIQNKSTEQLALQVAEKALSIFGQQEGEVAFIHRAPETRQALWRELDIVPRGVDREVVEMMHRTSMGVDMDYRSLMLQGARTALADGWGGSMIATELQDILFGTPSPLRGQVNLGVISKSDVNIVVHGHEPVLSEMLAVASKDRELLELAKSQGASGINLAGICCTANEILLRHGLPIAGNVLQQELAIATGAVEAMIVDVQCIMPSLPSLCKNYHTLLITTSAKGRIEGAKYLEFTPEHAYDTAKEIIRQAIFNFPNRGPVDIPDKKMDLVAGFSHEAIVYMLGGRFRGSYTPLNDNIINGRIKGVAELSAARIPRSFMTRATSAWSRN